MRYLKTAPLFLFLLPVFFCLHGAVEYFGYVTAAEIITLCLIILCIVTLLFFIIRLFTKNTLFAALITFYISLWNLFFGVLHQLLKDVNAFWLMRYTVLLPLLCISTVVWIIVLKRKKNFQAKLLFYFNILLVIYCIYDVSLLLIRSFSKEKPVQTHVSFNYKIVTAKPDIYYLLFDGYPGYKSLEDNFGYQNDSLYSFFKKNDFEILPVRSNYDFTYFSMASVFNMDYIKKIPYPDSITQADYLERMKEVKHAEIFSILSSMGYSLKNLSIFDIGKNESFTNSEAVVSGVQLLTHKILYRKFFKDVGWLFATGKYALPFLKRFFLRKDDFNRRVEKELRNSIYDKRSAPRFLYAHFFLPHEPIYFDSAGNYLPPEVSLSRNTVLDKNYYLGYVKYTTTKIISIADEIIKNDPKSVVVIMSDHGYKYFKGEATRYISDNICAIRFGDPGYVSRQPVINSNVNFFRYLFNSIYHQQLPYVKDSLVHIQEYAPR